MHGEDDHPLASVGLQQTSRRFDAVDIGHRHIHQHHVGSEFEGEPNGCIAIARFADHLDAFSFQPAAETLAEHCVVVDEQCC